MCTELGQLTDAPYEDVDSDVSYEPVEYPGETYDDLSQSDPVFDDPIPIPDEDDGERYVRKPVTELTPQELGALGEDIAAGYLVRHGYDILERNWTCPGGEADIIALDSSHDDKDTVVLLEVKTRLALGETSESIPELAVDFSKQRRYRQIALMYMVRHPEVNSIRFDVIAVNVVGEGASKLRHLFNAYCLDD